MAAPELTHVFTAHVAVAPALELGELGAGRRRIVPIQGGRVAGPRLSGTVLAGGADWQIVRAGGTAEIVARYTIRAEDGTLIGVVNSGLRRAAPEVLARLAAGEAVDPAQYYFRTVPVFEAPPGPHAWLTETVFVATGARRAAEIEITVFALG
ncbi:MAG: DUF3237 domain-containing protein [Rhodospirillales bacterium]|nr:DUF3237 domain-containing protein [Rhodospirillales bacterium]